MGLLDSLANSALSALAGQGGTAPGAAPSDEVAAAAAHPQMMDVLGGLLGGGQGGSSGLGGLLAMAQQAGLGEIVASWIGTGKNLPISADQIGSLLGNGQIQDIAQRLGLPPELASQALSHLLPHAVDHLTPDGQVPSNDMLEQGLSLLRSMSAGR
ncbi:YidB family protein [Pelomonas sp. KK5]|uniref:YidB family protein n=1 Tax=Pelomonas sp. KK5 TaxID=1855730 RepID=UPI00097C226C|nr:YidB family protein [Pelomonas sp. KK5]